MSAVLDRHLAFRCLSYEPGQSAQCFLRLCDFLGGWQDGFGISKCCVGHGYYLSHILMGYLFIRNKRNKRNKRKCAGSIWGQRICLGTMQVFVFTKFYILTCFVLFIRKRI